MSPTKASCWRSSRRGLPTAAEGDARASARPRAAVIGSVHADAQHFVQMTTAFGGKRIVDWLTGEQLPRIC
jgi:hydrogenase maturation factor